MSNPTPPVEASKTPADRVQALIFACLFNEPPADPAAALMVEGPVLRMGFDPAAVARNADAIHAVIDELVKDEFYEGWSFLQLCEDRQGRLWGQHASCQELVLLALAVKRARYCAPRHLWGALPGGMPYVQFCKRDQPFSGAVIEG